MAHDEALAQKSQSCSVITLKVSAVNWSGIRWIGAVLLLLLLLLLPQIDRDQEISSVVFFSPSFQCRLSHKHHSFGPIRTLDGGERAELAMGPRRRLQVQITISLQGCLDCPSLHQALTSLQPLKNT